AIETCGSRSACRLPRRRGHCPDRRRRHSDRRDRSLHGCGLAHSARTPVRTLADSAPHYGRNALVLWSDDAGDISRYQGGPAFGGRGGSGDGPAVLAVSALYTSATRNRRDRADCAAAVEYLSAFAGCSGGVVKKGGSVMIYVCLAVVAAIALLTTVVI